MGNHISNKSLTIVLVIALVCLVIVAAVIPKQVDWSLSYSNKHGKPLGEKLVYSVLPSLFPDQSIVSMHSRLEDFLEGTIPLNTNFIYITDIYHPNEDEVEKLLEVVGAGNNLFIAAESFSEEFAKPLNLNLEQIKQEVNVEDVYNPDSINYNYANRKLKTASGYWFKKAVSDNFFTSYDTINTTVLGYNRNGKTNFVRIKHGKGFIYLNNNPLSFTNYHLLSGYNSEYIFKCFSYLPVFPTVWDEFYKPGSNSGVSEISYILNDRALRIAWYLLLIGVLVYFIFKGKRYQRAIPVITPPKNNSLDFVETVGRLYFLKQDHKGIAQKRFIFFLDFLRTRYYVDTSIRDGKLIEEVSKKSGIAERAVASLFKVAGNLDKVIFISQEDLQQFNRQIEYFYKNCR